MKVRCLAKNPRDHRSCRILVCFVSSRDLRTGKMHPVHLIVMVVEFISRKMSHTAALLPDCRSATCRYLLWSASPQQGKTGGRVPPGRGRKGDGRGAAR